MGRFFTVTGLASLCLVTFASLAVAQDYESLEVKEDYYVEPLAIDAGGIETKDHRNKYRTALVNIRNGEKAAKEALTAGNAPSAAFFNDYVFPAMTSTDRSNLSTLGKQRAEFLKSYLGSQVRGGSRQQMIQLTIDAMQKICVNEKLHPAARLNAVYLIAQLDDSPPVRLQNLPPKPSTAALTALRSIFVSQDQNQFPAYLKVASLAGIERHVKTLVAQGSQIDQGIRGPIVAEINKLLAQDIDPKNPDLSYWLKRRSMQVGGLIGDTKTADLAIAMLKSDKVRFWLQMDCLAAIEKIGVGATDAAKNKMGVQTVGDFVVRTLKNEATNMQKKLDDLVYTNMLFQDADLEANGTNYEGAQPAPTGELVSNADPNAGDGRSGGGGSGGGKFGSGGMGAGGPPPGMGAGGGSGPGGGAGPGMMTEVFTGGKLDLPNYELQSTRSRLKALGVLSQNAIGATATSGLQRFVDSDTKTALRGVVSELGLLIKDSTIGIVDLDARKRKRRGVLAAPVDDEEARKSSTQKLIEFCKQKAEDLNDNVTNLKKK